MSRELSREACTYAWCAYMRAAHCGAAPAATSCEAENEVQFSEVKFKPEGAHTPKSAGHWWARVDRVRAPHTLHYSKTPHRHPQPADPPPPPSTGKVTSTQHQRRTVLTQRMSPSPDGAPEGASQLLRNQRSELRISSSPSFPYSAAKWCTRPSISPRASSCASFNFSTICETSSAVDDPQAQRLKRGDMWA